jgi:hypothetical protein
MAVTEQLYTKDDFKQAVSALLPPGEYWQYEQGDPLDGLLAGLATEFKTIHDETKINPLYQEDNADSGWKLADYQRILAEHEMAGTVYDDSSTPNLIYIDIAHSQAAGNLMQTLEDYRLPHSAFCFTYNNRSTLYVAVSHHSLQINHHIMPDVFVWDSVLKPSLGQNLLGTNALGV